jgi:predicted site-specific integrase-resolvase
MPTVLSTRDVADLLGVETWRVRRLFEDGTLPEPGRFVGKRAIPRELLPRIIDALRARGWFPAQEPLLT